MYTASYYAPEDWVGKTYRVSRQHPRGRRVQWQTLPFFYPERELLLGYRNGDINFEEFSQRYRRGLDEKASGVAEFQEWAAAAPTLGDFTLLCFERTGEPCHRHVLARWLLEHVAGLEARELR